MKSSFVRVVVGVAAINLSFFALPSVYVMFVSDVGFSSLLDHGDPLHTAIWIHRLSVVSAIAVAIALFMLLTKRRFGNTVTALVLAAFIIQMAYLAFYPEGSIESGPLKRLEYTNEEFGRNAEQIVKFVHLALESLLIYVLVSSKRIRQAYGQYGTKS